MFYHSLNVYIYLKSLLTAIVKRIMYLRLITQSTKVNAILYATIIILLLSVIVIALCNSTRCNDVKQAITT